MSHISTWQRMSSMSHYGSADPAPSESCELAPDFFIGVCVRIGRSRKMSLLKPQVQRLHASA